MPKLQSDIRGCGIMEMNQLQSLLPKPGWIFTKNEFADLIHEVNPQYSERSVYWLLRKLQQENKIQKLGKNIFETVCQEKQKMPYTYEHSSEWNQIVSGIEKEYPLVDFQAWELIQLNEFVNHQIAHNTVFIEVEDMLEEAVFHTLKSKFPCVLLFPSEETFYRYRSPEQTIVILKLISEAPKPVGQPYSAPLEKLLVDLFSRKLTGHLIERAEYPAVYEEAFSKYLIDQKKMFRYARRRGVEEEMKELIRTSTNIKLITKKGKYAAKREFPTGEYREEND